MHFLDFYPFLIYSFSLLHATVTKNGDYVITLCVTTYKTTKVEAVSSPVTVKSHASDLKGMSLD